jgi:hypothetical protein
MGIVAIFVLFMMVVIFFMWIQNKAQEVEYVKSTIDDKTYLVQKLPDSKEAADRLANLNRDAHTLIKHLMSKYPKNKSVKRLYEKYNDNAISEGSHKSGYSSYSVDKGRKVVLCIRQVDNSFVDHNILIYVFFHELGHIMTVSVGHTSEFWDQFKFILKEAVDIGLYNKVDFGKQSEAYCNITISSSVI